MHIDPDGGASVAGVPTVTAYGEAAIRAQPDEALLLITVSALHAGPGPALADVARQSAAVEALLTELEISSPDRQTAGVTVGEEFDHTERGRRSLGFRARASVSVRLTDAALIGRLIARAANDLQARVDGPHWQIAPGNPVYLEAARQAAADAKRRAQALAEGSEARLGPLLKVCEPADSLLRARVAWRTPALAAADEPMMPIERGQHEVRAVVQATFALDQPDRQ